MVLTRPAPFLHREAVKLNGLAEKYGQRPSDFMTFRRALPADLARFDLAVMLWASAEQVADLAYARQMSPT